MFTQPWTIEIPMTRWDDGANQIYESACHEGNYALTSILNGRPSAGPVGWTGMDEEDE